MKMVVLTGLGNETNLRTEETEFVLSFNNGALRILVSEETMKQVVGYVYLEEGTTPSTPEEPPGIGVQRASVENELVDEQDDGVPSL